MIDMLYNVKKVYKTADFNSKFKSEYNVALIDISPFNLVDIIRRLNVTIAIENDYYIKTGANTKVSYIIQETTPITVFDIFAHTDTETNKYLDKINSLGRDHNVRVRKGRKQADTTARMDVVIRADYNRVIDNNIPIEDFSKIVIQ